MINASLLVGYINIASKMGDSLTLAMKDVPMGSSPADPEQGQETLSSSSG
jgi:hypothetical protein